MCFWIGWNFGQQFPPVLCPPQGWTQMADIWWTNWFWMDWKYEHRFVCRIYPLIALGLVSVTTTHARHNLITLFLFMSTRHFYTCVSQSWMKTKNSVSCLEKSLPFLLTPIWSLRQKMLKWPRQQQSQGATRLYLILLEFL